MRVFLPCIQLSEGEGTGLFDAPTAMALTDPRASFRRLNPAKFSKSRVQQGPPVGAPVLPLARFPMTIRAMVPSGKGRNLSGGSLPGRGAKEPSLHVQYVGWVLLSGSF